jgi:hypothetical protein
MLVAKRWAAHRPQGATHLTTNLRNHQKQENHPEQGATYRLRAPAALL